MKRYLTLSRLFSSLILVPTLATVAQARQLPPPDDSPGWAIILADDYKGENSPLYPVVQYDAVNWYRLLVTKMHFAPDHIILLADYKPSTPFDEFVKSRTLLPAMNEGDKMTAFASAGAWKDYNPDDRRGWIKKQLNLLNVETPNSTPKDGDLMGDIQNFRYLISLKGNMLPLAADPTAQNFRVARNIISHLANPNQMVAIIVATHAGTNPALVMTKPDSASAAPDASVPPSSWLTASDFTLKDCKAGRRLLLMDNSLRYFDEKIEAKSDPTFGSAVNTAFSGKNSLVMLASNGTSISWPYARSGKEKNKPDIFGSAFFHSFEDFIGTGENYDLGQSRIDVEGNFRMVMGSLKRQPSIINPLPVGYRKVAPFLATSAEKLQLTALLGAPTLTAEGDPNQKLELVDTEKVQSVRLSPGIQVVNVSGVPVATVPDARANAVAKRFRMATNSQLRRADIEQIRAAYNVESKDWVVLMPDKVIYTDPRKKTGPYMEKGHPVKWFVTADRRVAALRADTDLEQAAKNLAGDIKMALVKTFVGHLGPSTNPTMLFVRGCSTYNSGDYNGAAELFEKAVQYKPNYPAAYVWLGKSFLASGKKDEAREQVEFLHDFKKENPGTTFDPDTEKELNNLDAATK